MNIENTKKTIKALPNHVSVMLKGNHGIGKSQVVKQVADELGIAFIDFRLSQNDVGDIKGIPFQRNGRTVFSPPEFFPLTEKDALELQDLLGLEDAIHLGKYGPEGILFLDEINRASREVQQAAFELVLDHRLNLRDLPEGWKVITAINDNDDLYTVGSLDPAFVSRFMVIDFAPSSEEWMKWAREEGNIHDSVIQFLTKHPEFLDPNTDTIDENNKEGVRKLYDRRSWHKFSQTIQRFEELEIPFLKKDPEVLTYMTQVAAGFMGSVCSIKWMKFIESDYESMNADIILNHWDKNVEAKIKSIVKAGRIPELAAYNELIIHYFEDKKDYGKNGIKNLTNYLSLMPKEVGANFWQAFNLSDRAFSEKWYTAHPSHAELILSFIVNPKNLKSATPTS